MKKDIHLRVDKNLYNELSELSLKKNQSKNYIINNMINDSLNNLKTQENINRLNINISKIIKDIYYIKKLLIQAYVDMDLEQKEVNTSKNLIKFDKSLKRDKIYD